MRMKKINSKIPGKLPPTSKSEIDGKITDLTSKNVPELLELRERQVKLLNNKAFISKLKDKGARIQTFYDKINKELKAKQEEEQTCRLLSNLKLDKESVQHIEWKGKSGMFYNKDTYLDSDDDSEPEDVFHILSQSTVQSRIKILPPDKSLITSEDLENISKVPHVKYIVDMENRPKSKLIGQYKPYQTTKSDFHNPKKEVQRKKHNHWEITAATPPPIVHGPTKVLSLEESLKLQKQYNVHMKEIEAKHAADKLLTRSRIHMSNLPEDLSVPGGYREIDSNFSESDGEESDNEVHDEEPECGGVTFTIMK